MKMRGLRALKLLVSGWFAVVLFCSCAVVPETGRRQVVLLSPSQEMEMGLTAFNEMKKEVPVSRDLQATAMLKRVGQRIASVAELPNAQWEFVLFDSKEVNAFCLPGGKVGVYSGILPITKDEEGLATVIGHEVAHAVARHGGERVSEAMLLQTGGQIVGMAASSSDPRLQAAINTAYGLGTTVGRQLPHSRKQESEADYIGLLYMARAGYNPEAAVEFWQRFAQYDRQAGGGTPWFLRTHPMSEQRIRDIKRALPKAKAEYKPNPQAR